MRKVSITDICSVTGLSRSTVDRALNERGQVHPRTHATIQRAIQNLARNGPQTSVENGTPVDIFLRLGAGMMRQMQRTFDQVKEHEDQFIDLCQLNEETVLRHLRDACADNERTAIVAVKDTDRIRSQLIKSRKSGKKIVALISELGTDARDAFVGIENKAAGATAAYLITEAIGKRPATVGVVVGDNAFRCHEDREIGFRTTLREIGGKVVLAGEARGEDNPDRTYHAVLRMLEAHPGIGAIYNVSGGNEGLARALKELGRERDIIVVSHELTHVSLPLLQENSLNFLFSQDPHVLLVEAIRLARTNELPIDKQKYVDFGVYTRFNLPEYARNIEL